MYTLQIGPLDPEWRQKIDPATGRKYFKNVVLKITTWIDPRSKLTRPLDPLQTVGDELPCVLGEGWRAGYAGGKTK